MTARALARQYAHALFEVAQKNGRLDRVRREVAEFAALVASHEELARVFSNPGVSIEQKAAVVRTLIEAAGGLAPEVERFLLLVADRDRLMWLGEMAAAFLDRCQEAERVVRAEITAAAPLDDREKAALLAALSKAVDRHVLMTERVDPAVIGGIVARVGSVVFDGTVARQIERLREKLLADV